MFIYKLHDSPVFGVSPPIGYQPIEWNVGPFLGLQPLRYLLPHRPRHCCRYHLRLALETEGGCSSGSHQTPLQSESSLQLLRRAHQPKKQSDVLDELENYPTDKKEDNNKVNKMT